MYPLHLLLLLVKVECGFVVYIITFLQKRGKSFLSFRQFAGCVAVK